MLTARELNRALLARQLLLERSSLSIPTALEQVGGLQTQYTPSGYIGLWTRLRDFERPSLTEALETKTVVQATLMRVTIHLVSARDYWPLATAVREARRANFLRVFKVDRHEIERAADRVRQMLAGDPLRRDEMQKAIGVNNQVWYGVGLWLDLVRVPPSGTWERRRADLFTTAEQWLGASTATRESGMDLLVKRYLEGFGPARAKDIAVWGGVDLPSVVAALERVSAVRYRDEQGVDLFDLPGAPLPPAGTPAPVRFLPTWDATLLVHARQAQVIAEEHRPLVFNVKTPHSVGTFLVDGSVAGKWKEVKGRVIPEPIRRLSAAERREVEREAESLSAFHA